MKTVMLSTTEYEFSHGKEPRGMGSWAFEFRTIDVSEVKAKVAALAHNACQSDGYSRMHIDVNTYPGKLLVWVSQANYGDAQRAAITVVKMAALRDTVIGKVCS